MKRGKPQSFRAMLFDCGGTLAVYQPEREKLFAAVLREAGYQVPMDRVNEAYRAVAFWMKLSSVKVTTPEGRLDFYDRFHEKICEFLCLSSAASDLKVRLRRKFAAERCRWTPAPGAVTLLKALQRSGVPAGIVANWDPSLRQKCADFGFLPHLKFVIASAEEGMEKPDPRIFQKALKRLGLEKNPSSVLYLGDDYRLDILGAASAGLKTALIDPKGQHPGADCRRFRSLAEFLKSIEFVTDKETRFKL